VTDIRVRIEVEIDGTATDNGRFSATLAWQHTHSAGDNPRYYGRELLMAIRAASERAKNGAQVYGGEGGNR
jgi:hypothetical protein